MPRLLTLGYLAILAVLPITSAFAATDRHTVAGRYRWVAPAEAADFFHRHHIATPTSTITLGSEGTFRYVASDDQGSQTCLGTYSLDGDLLYLNVETGDGAGLPHRLHVNSFGIYANGVHFLRERPVVVMEHRAPTSSLPDASYVVQPPGPAPIPIPIPVAHTEIEGIWTLRSANGEVTNQRFTFCGDGTFRHSGTSTSCAGRYRVCDDGVELTYTEVDGQVLDGSANMHKRLPFIEGRIAFLVDSYRYERSGG